MHHRNISSQFYSRDIHQSIKIAVMVPAIRKEDLIRNDFSFRDH